VRASPGARRVQRDLRQPAAQARASLEPRQGRENLDPGFLHDVLGRIPAYERTDHVEQKFVMSLDQLPQGRALSGAQPLEQGRLETRHASTSWEITSAR
jgi:hypothetical protein